MTLPSGETIRVRGAGEPSAAEAAAAAALGAVVDAARARFEAEHPDREAARVLWARIDAARGELSARGVANAAGVSVRAVFRVLQGQIPGDAELQALERWLARAESPGP